MTQPLTQYLRMYRKRTGLSQVEVGLLLGHAGGSEMSRHERGGRLPTLETALAYGLALGVPVEELFAGVLFSLEENMTSRARNLRDALLTGPRRDTAIRHLSDIIERIGRRHSYARGEDTRD